MRKYTIKLLHRIIHAQLLEDTVTLFFKKFQYNSFCKKKCKSVISIINTSTCKNVESTMYIWFMLLSACIGIEMQNRDVSQARASVRTKMPIHYYVYIHQGL